jgi:hypothetical protein
MAFEDGRILGLGHRAGRQENRGAGEQEGFRHACLPIGSPGASGKGLRFGYGLGEITGIVTEPCSSDLNLLTGFPGQRPRGIGIAYPDFTSPHLLVATLLAALRHRQRTGQGQEIHLAQLSGMVSLLGVEWMQYRATGRQPPRRANRDHNPLGTEGDEDRQDGEPYEDVGLDGVAGTCQYGTTPPSGTAACYDSGEGDNVWTLSPNVSRWYTHDISNMLAALDATEQRRVGIWMDAGIRDFLNASVSANAGFGQLMSRFQMPGAIYDSFSALGGLGDANYDFTFVPFQDMPDNVYMRYGNPDASEAEILRGDGRHVGTGIQIINRASTVFAWLEQRWPNGDRLAERGAGGRERVGHACRSFTGH